MLEYVMGGWAILDLSSILFKKSELLNFIKSQITEYCVLQI